MVRVPQQNAATIANISKQAASTARHHHDRSGARDQLVRLWRIVWPYPLFAFGLLVASVNAQADDIVLAEFNDVASSLSWTIVNDTVMGGRSNSRFRIQDNALQFAGTLNTRGGGFASVRSGPLSVSAGAQRVIRLRVKGDGRDYQLRLTSASTATTYRAIFSTDSQRWLVVELPLEQFQATWRGRLLDRPPIQAADIGGIGLLIADGEDGPFSVSVDWIALSNSQQ